MEIIVDIKWMKYDGNDRFIFPTRTHGTSAWKGILATYNEVMMNNYWNVGNGERVNFWNDT